MNIIQCSLCKKPFQSYGGKVCGDCLKKLDDDFIKVRDYIDENKHADIDKIAEETEVSKQAILYLLKDGRLIIEDAEAGGGMLFCEVCKKPITTGRMCKECKGRVAMTMQKHIETKNSPGTKKNDSSVFKGAAMMQKGRGGRA